MKRNDVLSPNLVKRLLDKLFLNNEMQYDFNSVETTVIPKRDALTDIFNLPQLKKLYLQIKLPNPDEMNIEEQELLDRFDRLNIAKATQEYISNGDPIQPDNELRTLAEIASQNGFVKGTGKDEEGTTVELSTEDIPMRERISVDNEPIAEIEALHTFRLLNFR